MIDATVIQAIVQSIIEHQKSIIGPLAVEQAKAVDGITISDGESVHVSIVGEDYKKILEQLVGQYEVMFGMTSVGVCKDAIHEVKVAFSPKDLPAILQ